MTKVHVVQCLSHVDIFICGCACLLSKLE